MTDDAAAKLLATVEALMVEVRALRKEAREDREARELLSERKAADAARSADYRARRKAEISHVTPRDNHVTPEVVSSVLDLVSVQTTKKQLPPASRDNHVASRDTAATWVAYSAAYSARYGAEPRRNATTNAQMAQVVKRLGVEESPLVAAFYVNHNQSFYVQKLHPVGLLLKDAESLRTQWATGRKVTATDARQQDQTEANVSGWEKHLKGAANGVE